MRSRSLLVGVVALLLAGCGLSQSRSRTGSPSGATAPPATVTSATTGASTSSSSAGVLIVPPIVVTRPTAAVGSVVAPAPSSTSSVSRWLYAANSGKSVIDRFSIDPVTGSIASLGSTALPARSGPWSLAATPDGKYVYCLLLSSIACFAVDPATGNLAALPSGNATTGKSPWFLAVDPQGAFAAVANSGDDSVTSYRIDPATGALTTVSTARLAAGSRPQGLAFEPGGRFLYTANMGSNDASVVAVDLQGNLTVAGTVTNAGTLPRAVTVHPSGDVVYVSATSGKTITTFSRNAGTGLLTPLGPPLSTGTGSAYALAARGDRLLAGLSTLDTLVSHPLDPKTREPLAAPAGASVASGRWPIALALDPSGTMVFTADYSGDTVSAYRIDATGTVTRTGQVPVPPGSGPHGLALVR